MKTSQYTFLIIPDGDSDRKEFTFSKWWIRAIIAFFVSIMFGTGVILWFYIPQISEFKQNEILFEKMLAERVKVMDMYRDLNRLTQMEDILRKNFNGINNDDKNPIENPRESFAVSYIENIPSHAPVDGFLTQRLIDKSKFWRKNHYGIDIAIKEEEPVAAAAAGRIVFSGWTYDLGNLIIIYHGDDYFTHYGHNQLNLIPTHGEVERGDIIALAGSTGISSGPHLHFEIWKGGRAIDPLIFFPEYTEKDVSSVSNGEAQFK